MVCQLQLHQQHLNVVCCVSPPSGRHNLLSLQVGPASTAISLYARKVSKEEATQFVQRARQLDSITLANSKEVKRNDAVYVKGVYPCTFGGSYCCACFQSSGEALIECFSCCEGFCQNCSGVKPSQVGCQVHANKF